MMRWIPSVPLRSGSQRSVEQLENITISGCGGGALSRPAGCPGIRRLERKKRRMRGTKGNSINRGSPPNPHHYRGSCEADWTRGGGLAGWMLYLGISARIRFPSWNIFPRVRSVIFLDEPARLKEKGETVELEFREAWCTGWKRGTCCRARPRLLYPAAEILARMQKPYAVMLTGLDQKLPGMKVNQNSA